MKILRVISLGYIAGGAENGIVKLHPYLMEKGHSVRVLASDLGDDKQHFNNYSFKGVSPTGPLKPLFFTFNPSSFFALKAALREYKPDVVHLHVMHEVTPSVLFLLRNYPTVMTLHGPETFLSSLLLWCLKPSNFKDQRYAKENLNVAGKLTYLYFRAVQKPVYRYGLKHVDTFIAPSRYIEGTAAADVSPIVHLPNFIELRRFAKLENTHNLLYVGRLEKVKGVEYLIKAVPLIIEKFPLTTLTVIGDGRDKADLVELAAQLKIQDRVSFPGWVDSEALDAYYHKCAIVVLPSIWPENFPTVCNEAMSVGRPVIGTNVGGVGEIIVDGINGYVVQPQNSQQIADRVVLLFKDEEQLKRLGANARQRAESFSIEKYADDIEHLYEAVVNKYAT